jgi:hypothetical protein
MADVHNERSLIQSRFRTHVRAPPAAISDATAMRTTYRRVVPVVERRAAPAAAAMRTPALGR